jgi:hypothetical protein
VSHARPPRGADGGLLEGRCLLSNEAATRVQSLDVIDPFFLWTREPTGMPPAHVEGVMDERPLLESLCEASRRFLTHVAPLI